MTFQNIKSDACTWWHISPCDAAARAEMQAQFRYHALDYEDIAEPTEFPKLDEYKYYVMAVFIVPNYNPLTREVTNAHFAMFLDKKSIVTAAVSAIPQLDDVFLQMKNSSRARKETLHSTQPVSLLTYKILDAVFSAYGAALAELVREARELEKQVSSWSTRSTTVRLGTLRRNILHLMHTLEPQRRVVHKLSELHRDFLPEEHRIYFDDVEDQLEGYGINVANLRSTVDCLFEVNETFLAHRTGDQLSALTIISVALMPPTLLAGYYGMNVVGLPFAHHPWLPTLFIVLSLLASLLAIILIGKSLARKS